jgi:hypothetical protein
VKKTPIKAKAAANAITTLKKKLADAFDSLSDDHSPKYERARYGYALKAFSDFLKQVGIDYRKRLYRLVLALDDLNRGIVDPLLEPTKTGGPKNRNVSWDWCARAHVSVGMLALLKTELHTRKSAAQWAARRFPDIKKLAGLSRTNPSSTVTKILSWLDDFNKGTRGKIKNPQALAIFVSGRKLIEKLPKDTDKLYRVANRMFALALELRLRD